MFRKLVQDISSNIILLFLALSCLDTGWSNPMPAKGESNWKCEITKMNKKKAIPGQCYSYQVCQWRGIGDYDMEVMNCPEDKVFDENINECVSDKVLGFNFDKTRCESDKTVEKPQKPQAVNLPKQTKPRKNRKKPMTMAEMMAMSEQLNPSAEAAKLKESINPADNAKATSNSPPMVTMSPEGKPGENPVAEPGSPQPEDAGPSAKMAGRSMGLAPLAPLGPIESSSGGSSSKSRSRTVVGVGNIKQPEFFKPFNNFAVTKKARILSHDPFVKPNP